MASFKHLIICLLGLGGCLADGGVSAEPVDAGLLYAEFPLTLALGHRTEILGPAYYSEQQESQHTWALPPLTLSLTQDPVLESEEFDFAYPFLTYDRYGAEYRWQFFQLLSFAGGTNQDATSTRRFTLFPLYFQQRSNDTNQDYTAVVPFYGHLKHRLFKDEIDFVLFPLYSKTRKKDVVTYNMPYPIFDLRYGDGLRGWQVWPFTGHEHKEITTRTNQDGEVLTIGGHDSRFVLWPFYTQSLDETVPTNAIWQEGLIPFYSIYHSKPRDSISYGWPIGVTHTQDREKKYEEWDAPWPLVEFAHGEGKTERRVWPFFNQAHNKMLEDYWYLWPVYKYNRLYSPPLDRDRTRILFFLYSQVNEKNTETGKAFRRQDCLPFYTHRVDFNGNERLQILAILEPFFPGNKSIERDYSPLWSLWRSERNPREGKTSQSLLWNLYRRDTAPRQKKLSLLFGLIQYRSTPAGRQWRLCYVPLGKISDASPEPPPRH